MPKQTIKPPSQFCYETCLFYERQAAGDSLGDVEGYGCARFTVDVLRRRVNRQIEDIQDVNPPAFMVRRVWRKVRGYSSGSRSAIEQEAAVEARTAEILTPYADACATEMEKSSTQSLGEVIVISPEQLQGAYNKALREQETNL